MENGKYQTLKVTESIDARSEILKPLESTEGWDQLSDRQQQLIRASLIVQGRAVRGGTFADNKAILVTNYKGREVRFVSAGKDMIFNGELSKEEEAHRSYRDSQEIVANLTCQEAIQILEQEYYPKNEKPHLPDDFFVAEYLSGNDFEAVVEFVKDFGFPCVVHITKNQYNSDEITQMVHSFVILGTNGSNLVVWEKLTDNLPFLVSSLSQVRDMYPDSNFYWGVRSLRSSRGVVEVKKITK